jgi:hypothetical protein
MGRVTGFLPLVSLALGCFIAAWLIVEPNSCKVYPASHRFTVAPIGLIVLGGVLAFCSVVVPWCRYLRATSNRIGLLDYALGVLAGLLFGGFGTILVVVLFLSAGTQCGE